MAKESSAYLGKGGLSMYYCIYVLVHRAFVQVDFKYMYFQIIEGTENMHLDTRY